MAQVFDQFAQREDRIRLQLLGADVVGDRGARVGAEYAGLVHMCVEDLAGLSEAAMNCLDVIAGVTAWLSA